MFQAAFHGLLPRARPCTQSKTSQIYASSEAGSQSGPSWSGSRSSPSRSKNDPHLNSDLSQTMYLVLISFGSVQFPHPSQLVSGSGRKCWQCLHLAICCFLLADTCRSVLIRRFSGKFHPRADEESTLGCLPVSATSDIIVSTRHRVTDDRPC